MQRKKIALFAFNGDIACFSHVLLNALDMHTSGIEVKIVIEGAATALLKGFSKGDAPFTELFREAAAEGLIDCVCMACSKKTGSYEAAGQLGLEIAGSMSGHPAVSRYLFSGFEVITF